MSLAGIILALALLIFFAFRGKSLIWAAPICAMLVALTGGLDMLTAYTVSYMEGFVGFVKDWFPAFMLSAIFGQIMEDSGGAQAITKAIVRLLGRDKAIFVSILCGGVLAYGGISGFVIIFSMYPIVLGLFREADISRRLIPATVMAGAFTFAMSSMPGTPTIQNLIPGEYFNTSPMAAPVMGIVCSLVMFLGPILWLNYRAKKLRKQGEGYTDPADIPEETPDSELPNAWLCLLPFVVILVLLNVLKQHIVVSLLAGTLVILALLLVSGAIRKKKYIKNIGETFNKGCLSAVSAVMNTSAAVGFGSVVKLSPGFAVLEAMVLGIQGSPLIAESVAINILAGATGSASGGLRIALDALAPNFIQMSQSSGIPLEAFHRVGAIACGGLNTLPHDGAVVTYLSYCKIPHKKGYFDMFMVAGAIPILANIVAIILGTLGIV